MQGERETEETHHHHLLTGRKVSLTVSGKMSSGQRSGLRRPLIPLLLTLIVMLVSVIGWMSKNFLRNLI